MKKIIKSTAIILLVLTIFSVFSVTTLAATKPVKPQAVVASNVTANSLVLNWTAVEGADAYRVYVYADRKWKVLSDTTGTQLQVASLVSMKTYIFAVKSAKIVLGNIYFSDDHALVKVKTGALSPTTLTGVAGLNSVRLTWQMSPGATNYAVYKHDGRVWSLLGVVAAKVLTCSIKNLNYSTVYHFAVRPVTTGDGRTIIGPISNLLKIKTLDPNNVALVCGAYTDTAIRLNWTKAPNATGYMVYAYLGGAWKAVRAIPNANTLTTVFGNLNSDTVYYFMVRAFRKTGSNVLWYRTSNICVATTDPGVLDAVVYRIDSVREALSGDSYTVSYTTTDEKYGKMPVTVAKKGDDYFLKTKVDELPYSLLNNASGYYIIFDESKSYIKVPDISKELFSIKASMDEFLPGTDWTSKATIATFNSQKAVCETFTNPSGTKSLKFYFKTGKLLGIEEYGIIGFEERAIINSITSESDANLFEIPFGYNRVFYGAGISDN